MKKKLMSFALSAAVLLAAVPGAGFLQGTAAAFAADEPVAEATEPAAAGEDAAAPSGEEAAATDTPDGTETAQGEETTPSGSEEPTELTYPEETPQGGEGGSSTEPSQNEGEESGEQPSQPEEPDPAAGGEEETGGFVDVQDPSAYYYVPVYWAVDKKITNGTSATEFSPADPCTRGQIVTFLWRAAGEPAPKTTYNLFEDVVADQYYSKAVAWAVEQGISNGTSATEFSPEAPCTRGQIVTFLARYAKGEAEGKTVFSDVADPEQYYYNAVYWAVLQGITNGTSATEFSPEDPCTRGQIVTFLYRALLEKADNDGQVQGAFGIANISDRSASFDVLAQDVEVANGVVDVRATVTSVDAPESLRWISLSKGEDGVYSTTVNVNNYTGPGEYQVVWYVVTGDNKQISVKEETVTVNPIDTAAQIQEEINAATSAVYEKVGRDLRACFDYSVGLQVNTSTPTPPEGYTDSQWYALYGFNNGTGDFNVQAATFFWLAKNLGYDAHYIQGFVPLTDGTSAPHRWVEIDLSGSTYVFDPNLNRTRGTDGYKFTYGTEGTWMYTRYSRAE